MTYTANGWQFDRWNSNDSAINGTTDSILTFPKPSGGTVNITAVFGTNSTDHNAEDIAVVNRIIEENPGISLERWENNSIPPSSWDSHIQWSSASTDRRITGIYLNNQGLTGQLDLSGLSALTTLNCQDNNLTALDVCSAPSPGIWRTATWSSTRTQRMVTELIDHIDVYHAKQDNGQRT